LPDSVAAFPDGDDFVRIMSECGYERVGWRPLTFGIASIYDGHVR
jgi:demethylmenaquinone methyltransferase/2-methoxy-6-polyprenyl-1,4-benzoquinol methylase